MSAAIVLIIRDSRPGGGAEKQSLIFAQGLKNLGWEVFLYTEKFSIDHIKQYAPDVKILTLKRDILSLGRDTLAISFLKNDHILGWKLSWMGIKWVPFERIHPDYYVHFGNRLKLIRYLKLSILTFLHSSRSKGLFVQTETAALAWKEKHGYSKPIFIIPNSYNLPDTVKSRTIKNEIRIAIVGRLVPMKDPILALESFRYFLQLTNQVAKMIVLGEGEMREEINSYITSHGLEDKVEMLGFRPDAGKLLAESDLYLMTSHVEGMPNSLGEAMSLGIPCLTTDFPGGARELLYNGSEIQKKQIVLSRSPRDFAIAMQALTSDQELQSALSKENRETIRERYNSKVILQSFAHAIEKIQLLN